MDYILALGRQGGFLRKGAIFLLGSIIISAGIIMFFLPGPGALTIVAGLSILSLEFEWAKKIMSRMKFYSSKICKMLKKKFQKESSIFDADK